MQCPDLPDELSYLPNESDILIHYFISESSQCFTFCSDRFYFMTPDYLQAKLTLKEDYVYVYFMPDENNFLLIGY